MPQVYPPRKTMIDDNRTVDICRCGHQDLLHPIEGEADHGKCVSCLCPSYIHEQTMTARQASMLYALIDKQQRNNFRK